MKRDALIDFHLIPDRQLAIHKRLAEDWVAFCHGGKGGTSSPMFRQYRSTEVWREQVPFVKRHGDYLKGQKLNTAVCDLPPPHRVALQWFYIREGSPLWARRTIGCTMAALGQYLSDGRNMLVNRGA